MVPCSVLCPDHRKKFHRFLKVFSQEKLPTYYDQTTFDAHSESATQTTYINLDASGLPVYQIDIKKNYFDLPNKQAPPNKLAGYLHKSRIL